MGITNGLTFGLGYDDVTNVIYLVIEVAQLVIETRVADRAGSNIDASSIST